MADLRCSSLNEKQLRPLHLDSIIQGDHVPCDASLRSFAFENTRYGSDLSPFPLSCRYRQQTGSDAELDFARSPIQRRRLRGWNYDPLGAAAVLSSSPGNDPDKVKPLSSDDRRRCAFLALSRHVPP